jgi:hypothetical protein
MKRMLLSAILGLSAAFFCIKDTAAQNIPAASGPKKAGCLTYGDCGQHFPATRNGVTYDCICNCDGEDQCTPVSQSGGSGAAAAVASIARAPSTDQIIKGMVQQAAMEWALKSIFGLLNSPSTPQKSPEQIRMEQELAKKAEEERIAKFQAANNELGKQMKGNGPATEFFGIKGGGSGQLDLKPLPSGSAGRAGNTAWAQLNASQWLSKKAEDAANKGDLSEASFLSDQAFQAAVGAPLKVQVPAPPPEPSLFSSPENKMVYQKLVVAMNEQTQKTAEDAGELKKATEKKKESQEKLAEIDKKIETLKLKSPVADTGKKDDDDMARLKALQEERIQRQKDAEEAAQKEAQANDNYQNDLKIGSGLATMAQGSPDEVASQIRAAQANAGQGK